MIEAWTAPTQPGMEQSGIDEMIDDIVQEASAEPETQAVLEASRDDHALRDTLRTAMDVDEGREEDTDAADDDVRNADEPDLGLAASSGVSANGASPGDTRFDEAAALAGQHERVSASLLQRRMRIGLPRAERLIEQLEQAGIVAPSEGGPSRQVLRSADSAVPVLD